MSDVWKPPCAACVEAAQRLVASGKLTLLEATFVADLCDHAPDDEPLHLTDAGRAWLDDEL